jgi:hypothetical protein
MDTVCGQIYAAWVARGLTAACSGLRSAPPLMLSVTTSENVSLAADMVKQAIKTGQSVL